MTVIGITGSLASGKTQVARILKSKGARVFDADRAARIALKKGEPSYKAAVKIFGRAYLKKNGQFDRKKLALRVFANPRELRKLNILIHPGVIFECLGQIKRVSHQKGVIVLDVPLLFESKMDCLADFIVLVPSPVAALLKRASKKGISPALARKILASQWPVRKKIKRADFVIHNDGSPADLNKKVSEVWRQVTKSLT